MAVQHEPSRQARPGQTVGPCQSAPLTALIIAVIAFAVQQTSIVPAVSDVQAALHGSAEWSAWLVTVYLIVATVGTPAMGRLADLYGRRKLLLIGLGVFAAASIGAALAPNMVVLICWRAVQGVGGAVYPLALSIARDQTPPEQVEKRVSALTIAFGIGTAVGFVGGGLLAEYLSWRWIFVAGAVLVALAAGLVRRRVPVVEASASGRFDFRGAVILAVAAIALLSALTLVVPYGWASPAAVIPLVIAAAAGASWVIAERRTPDPLVDLHVLGERRVAIANLSTIGLGWTLFAGYLLIPRFSQTLPARAHYGLGAGSAITGLLLLPLAAGQVAAAAGAPPLSRHLHARLVFAAGLVLMTSGLAILTATRHSAVEMAVAAAVLGLGAGLALETTSTIATEGVASDVAAVSSAVNSTVRRLAGGIGGQVSTIVLAGLVIDGGGSPRFAAFVVCYAIAGAMCLGGALLSLVAMPA
ncbi:MAG TPA: MFS transporter [Frankiaceae bacterium]|nr:MFS transporter [Frankiaceae bacterium]